jgi:protease-4
MSTFRRLGALVAVLATVAVLTGCISLSMAQPKRSPTMALETLVPAQHFGTNDKVLLVGLDGLLTAAPDTGGFLSGPSTLERLRDVLDHAEKDPSIRAILLRIDSPGGSVAASDLIHHELVAFKKKTKCKIVAVCMGMAASGGYYSAMAADAIYVHPTSIVGSIGVIGLFPNLAGLSGKIGVDVRVVKSGEFKDMGSMWRPFSDPDRAILQGMIDSMFERFVTVVREGRPKLDEATVRRLADGRIYTAQEAVTLGLVDAMGYMDDAFAAARKAAGLSDAALVAYARPGQYVGHYYAETGSLAPRAGAEGATGSGTAGSGMTGSGTANSGAAGAAGATAAPQIHLFDLNLGGGAWSALPKAEGPFYYLWMP